MKLIKVHIYIICLFFGIQDINAQANSAMADTIVHIERVEGTSDLQTIIENDTLYNLPIGTQVRFYNGKPVSETNNPDVDPANDASNQGGSKNQTTNTDENASKDDISLATNAPRNTSNSNIKDSVPAANPATSPQKSTTSSSPNSSSTKKSASARSSSSRSSGSSSKAKSRKRKSKKAPRWNAFSKNKNKRSNECRY